MQAFEMCDAMCVLGVNLAAWRSSRIANATLLRLQEAFTVLNVPNLAVAAAVLDKTLLAGLGIEPGVLTAGAYEAVLLLLLARLFYRIKVRSSPYSRLTKPAACWHDAMVCLTCRVARFPLGVLSLT